MNLVMTIERVGNGYKITKYSPDYEGDDEVLTEEDVVQDDEEEDLSPTVNIKSSKELLYTVLNFFELWGSEHDKDRIVITTSRGEDEEYEYRRTADAYEHGLTLADEKAGLACSPKQEEV